MISRIINDLIQLIIGAARIGIGLIAFQFIPALFFVAVWMTQQALQLLPGQAARLHPGLVVVLSSTAWGLVWLLVWLTTNNFVLLMDLTLWVAIAGVLWGLAIGGAIARDWAPPPIIAPPVDPMQASGLHRDMLVEDAPEDSITIEELFEHGIFVGHNIDSHRDNDQ